MRVHSNSVLLIGALLIAQALSTGLQASGEQSHDGRKLAAGNNDDDERTTGAPNEMAATTTIYENSLIKDRTYGVIVDCGSSGTRVHIYHWNNELSYSELLHHVEPLRNPDHSVVTTKINKPLTSLENNPEKASEYFRPILDFITQHIPEPRHQFTGIYIMATAGMRLLDSDTQKSIMAETKKYIEENFPFPLVTTSVISGAAEGMYQWISVNAKESRFLTKDTDTKIRTLGIIEMGGASIQVTYRLQDGAKEIIMDRLPRSIHEAYLAQIRRPEMSRTKQINGAIDVKPVGKTSRVQDFTIKGRQVLASLKPMGKSVREPTTLVGSQNPARLNVHDKPSVSVENNEDDDDHDYVLHSTTFLGFGSNSARDATIDLLIKQHTKRFSVTKWWKKFVTSCFKGQGNEKKHHDDLLMTIEDPCLPLDYEELVQRPSRMFVEKHQTIGFSMEDNDSTFKVKLKGGSNYDKCKDLVETMLSTAKKERLNCEDKKPCTMDLLGEQFVPFNGAGSYMSYVALSDFYYTTAIMLNMPGKYNHNDIVSATREICNSSKHKLISEYPSIDENPKLKDRITSECFKAVWVDTFLVKGLRMPRQSENVETKGKIKDDDPEWTLGAVLDKSLSIEQASERKLESRQMLDPKYSQLRNLRSQLESTDSFAMPSVSYDSSVLSKPTYNPADPLSRTSSVASSTWPIGRNI